MVTSRKVLRSPGERVPHAAAVGAAARRGRGRIADARQRRLVRRSGAGAGAAVRARCAQRGPGDGAVPSAGWHSAGVAAGGRPARDVRHRSTLRAAQRPVPAADARHRRRGRAAISRCAPAWTPASRCWMTSSRLVLRRLEPFEGGFTLEMATAALSDRRLDAWTVAEALEGLVDHSLVQVDAEDRPRYRLFDGIRAYGAAAAGGDRRGRHRAPPACARDEPAVRPRGAGAAEMMPDARWIAEFSPEPAMCAPRSTGVWNMSRCGGSVCWRIRARCSSCCRWRRRRRGGMPPMRPSCRTNCRRQVLARYCIDHAGLLRRTIRSAAIWYSARRRCRARRTIRAALSGPGRQVVEDQELSQAAMRYAMGELVALAGRCEARACGAPGSCGDWRRGRMCGASKVRRPRPTRRSARRCNWRRRSARRDGCWTTCSGS